MNLHPFIKAFSKACALSFLFLTLTFNGFSQNKEKYNLLWEITGNGLKSPSFLFGSIHVKDKRAFNFSDSVMTAIEATSAFVMEVHPDSLMRSIFDEGRNSQRNIKDMLTEEQNAKLIEQFELQNGYKPDSSLLKNPFLIESAMKLDYSKSDDMETFVDAYLYGISRTLKKNVFGLESADDQVDLILGEDNKKVLEAFDRDDEAELENLEILIDIYSQGNLEEIWELLGNYDSSDLDRSDRNQVMAKGIQRLLKKETLFVTVGVAHLPGKGGLIALLEEAGFTLRPVEAEFTGGANAYQIDHSKMIWHSYNDTTDGYKIDFPSDPIVAKDKNSTRVVIFSDMMDESLYTTTSTFAGLNTGMNTEQYLDTVANIMFSNDKVELLNRKEVVRNGVKGIEAEMKTRNKFIKTRVTLENNHLFTLSVENKKDLLNGNHIDRFFDSFEARTPSISSDASWVDFSNLAGAFSIKLPRLPEEVKNEIPNLDYPEYPPFFANMYFATDKSKLVTYLVRYNDYPPGMFLMDKNLSFEGLTREFASKGKVVKEPRVIFKEGNEGRAMDVIIQGAYVEIQMYLRGNRTYLLLKENLNGSDVVDDDRFFNSFKFEKYSPYQGVPFSKEEDFKLVFPKQPFEIPDDEEEYSSFLKNSKSFYAVNDNSGGVYGLQSSLLSKYFRAESTDSLYNSIFEMMNPTNTVYESQEVVVGKVKGNDYYLTDTVSGSDKKFRIWIDGDRFYHQTVIASKEEMESRQVNDFFESIELSRNNATFDLKSSKASIIMEDLESLDSAVYKNALGAFDYYRFDKEELPLIYAALERKYSDDTLQTGARTMLIREFQTLSDDHTVSFLKKLYKDPQNSDRIRAEILAAVPIVDKHGYDWYLKSLIESPVLKIDNYWHLFSPLSDSLSYVENHLDEILTLLPADEYRFYILNTLSGLIAKTAKDSSVALFESRKDKISANAMSDLTDFKTDFEENSDYQKISLIYSYLSVLPYIDLPELTDDFTNQVLLIDSLDYLHTSALATRVIANLPVDISMVESQLDSLNTRYEILRAYYLAGKLDEVNPRYRSHDEFAKLLMNNYLTDYYDNPLSLQLLGNVKKGEDTYYAFEFSYEEEGVRKDYLGISGAFDNQLDKLDFEGCTAFTEFDLKDPEWIPQAEALISKMQDSD